MLLRLLAAFLGLVTAPLLATAGDAPFIASNAVDYLTLLPPPPEDSTPAGQADIDTILSFQANRTPAEVERAKRMDEQSEFSFARAVLGDRVQSKNFPKTKALFREMNKEGNIIIDAAKSHWARKRPYERDARVKLTVGKAGNASYPSGHSASAAMWAAVWSAVFPEKAEAFQAQVREVM